MLDSTGGVYPLSGTRHSHRTRQNGPKMASKGPFDTPKGSGACCDRSYFRLVLGPCRTPSRSQDPGGTGLKWAKSAEKGCKGVKTGPTGPNRPQQVHVTLSKGLVTLLKFSIFDRFWAHLAWSFAQAPSSFGLVVGWELVAVGRQVRGHRRLLGPC